MNKIEQGLYDTYQCPKCGEKKPNYILIQDHVIVGCNNCRYGISKKGIYSKMDFMTYIEQTAREIARGLL